MKRLMLFAMSICCGGRSGLDSPDPTPVSIVAADRATCALYSNGNVQCWGDFARHNFLYNDARDAAQPTTSASKIRYPTNARQMSAHHEACVVTGDELQCWGYGPIPPACSADSFCDLTKTQIYDAVQVSMSEDSGGCAVTRDGIVICWGPWYLTRDPVTNLPPSPTAKQIQLGLPASQVSVGVNHACALLSDGTIRCWGHASTGETAPNVYNSSRGGDLQRTVGPTAFPLADVQEVQAGQSTTCVRMHDDLYCWGDNRSHWLTNGAAMPEGDTMAFFDDASFGIFEEPVVLQPTKQLVPGHVRSFTLAHSTVCVVNDAGQLYCWGGNEWGQAAQGAPPFCYRTTGCPPTVVSVPSRVEGLDVIEVVNLGITHGCAVSTTKDLFCWGKNTSGELGDGTRTNRARPTEVLRTLERP